MNRANQEKVESYIASLGEALGRGGESSEAIVEEVRSDLEAHVARFQAGGEVESEAVRRALEEMGNPYELAHHMKVEMPPIGRTGLTRIRSVVACGIVFWSAILLWKLRPGVYGFSPGLVGGIVLIHLPAVLLVWPGIVWRKNWLFGLLPAGVSLVAGMLYSFAATTQTSEMPVEATAGEPVSLEAPLAATAVTGPPQMAVLLVFTGLVIAAIALLMAMQQRRQRFIVLVGLVFVVVSIEAVYQFEEWGFRKDLVLVRDYLDSYLSENGGLPDELVTGAGGLKLRSGHVSFGADGDALRIAWSRPLQPGKSIIYSSQDDEISIQD
ncbi:MAG: permease prefix domain 1-containing protein [Verrucomicrobiales bacterium]|nr:permease prefix domain 1-containing protein [Verrucomicrobiales bacterium]